MVDRLAGAAPAETGETRKRKGKREQNAKELRRRILDAARTLISQVGYQEATISKIRKLADISIATFYKYFDSKQAILIAILYDEHDASADAVAAAIAAPVAEPTDYIVAIIGAALDPPEEASHRAMWREIVAASVLMSGERIGVEGLEADRAFYSGQMREALGKLMANGRLLPDTPIETLINIIYCISSLEFQEFVCERYETREAFFAQLHRTIGSLLSPWQIATPAVRSKNPAKGR